MRLRHAQVAIIALLISALVMTIGLSLSKKTTIETTIDTNEEALRDAFNAAESGIDYYLKTGQKTYNVPTSMAKAEIQTKNLGGATGELSFGNYTVEGDTESFWLAQHNADGSLGSSVVAQTIQVIPRNINGALLVNLFYKTGASTFGVRRYGFNFSSDPARQIAGFTAATTQASVVVPVNSVLLTVTPLFSGANIAVNGTFPIQGEEISSIGRVGEVNTSESQAIKKVIIQRRYTVPSFLFDALVANGSILAQ